jgi:hypothetical protein
MRMLAEDELRDAVLLIFANKQVCILIHFFLFIKHADMTRKSMNEKKNRENFADY